ncbi:MAG: type II secretion system GspH family protein [Betaproteobacteria bacterium]|nr:type II secretion system GspH family protein [Betaproteobacteria bacterium]
MPKKQHGFTLIEIAIVLVIIGLLLGSVLKGQELITAARVRNLIAQQDDIKAAYFGFLDRYRLLPGDYDAATTNIRGISTAACNGGNGNANGQIELTAPANEMVLVWEHLSKAGFISRTYTCSTTETTATTPVNPYFMFLRLAYDTGFSGAGPTARHNLKTGNQMPSELLGEVDRKVDDDNPESGTFRFSAVSVTGTAPVAADCYSGAGASARWRVATAPGPNCGAASLF